MSSKRSKRKRPPPEKAIAPRVVRDANGMTVGGMVRALRANPPAMLKGRPRLVRLGAAGRLRRLGAPQQLLWPPLKIRE